MVTSDLLFDVFIYVFSLIHVAARLKELRYVAGGRKNCYAEILTLEGIWTKDCGISNW